MNMEMIFMLLKLKLADLILIHAIGTII
jgi:hypothetical protein